MEHIWFFPLSVHGNQGCFFCLLGVENNMAMTTREHGHLPANALGRFSEVEYWTPHVLAGFHYPRTCRAAAPFPDLANRAQGSHSPTSPPTLALVSKERLSELPHLRVQAARGSPHQGSAGQGRGLQAGRAPPSRSSLPQICAGVSQTPSGVCVCSRVCVPASFVSGAVPEM